MFVELFCSLCYMPGIKEYEYLQNDSGECNEFYKITVKYFNPKNIFMLNVPKKVLCRNCWAHIKIFHDFQQTVIKSRASFEEIYTNKSLQIKAKEYQITPSKTLDQINIQQFTSDINTEEEKVYTDLNDDSTDIEMDDVQYIIVIDSDSDESCNKTRTSLEQICVPKSPPLHIKVEEFQCFGVCNSGNETKHAKILKSTLQEHANATGKSTTKSDPINITNNSAFNVECNNFSNETRTSLEQISKPNPPFYIKVEEFQYSSDRNNDSVNKTKTSFGNANILKSPLHIKVDDATIFNTDDSDRCFFKTTSLEPSNIHKSPLHAEADEFLLNSFNIECNSFANEARTTFEQISLQKSPLHIKVEDQVTAFFKDGGNYIDTEVHQNQQFLEHQTYNKNFEMLNNIDEYDEKPLHKSKTSCKDSKHLFSSDDDDCDGEAIKNNTLVEEPVCDICGESCESKLVKIYFKKEEKDKAYRKCFNRYYYICGKLNTSKQTVISEKLPEFKYICPEAFGNQSILEPHATGSKAFKCEQCEKAYLGKAQLNKHIARVHMPKKCNRCDKTLQSPIALKRHKESYHNVCGICDEVFDSQKELKQHKDVYHEKSIFGAY